MAKLKSKKDMFTDLKSVGFGVAGGVAASYGATYLEQQPFMAGKEQFIPLAVTAAGVAAMVLVPQKEIQQVGLGIAIIGGTELVERLITKGTSMISANGVPPTPRGLGFTPQVTPAYISAGQTRTYSGIVVR